MTDGLLASAAAFVWTVALEFPVYALALPRNWGVARALRLTLAVNLLTHPALCAWVLTSKPRLGALATAELAVALIEAGVLVLAVGPPRRLAWALLAAGSANALSWGTSWLAQAL